MERIGAEGPVGGGIGGSGSWKVFVEGRGLKGAGREEGLKLEMEIENESGKCEWK